MKYSKEQSINIIRKVLESINSGNVNKMQYASEELYDLFISNISIDVLDQDTKVEVLLEALRKIARISHMGGLIYLGEADALTEIRKMTLPYFDTKEPIEETKQALATYDKLSEVKHDTK